MKLNDFENRRKKSKHNFPTTLSSPCLYLLMGFNIYLGRLVKMEDATSISTISLVDVEVRSFSPYIYVPTPRQSTPKTII